MMMYEQLKFVCRRLWRHFNYKLYSNDDDDDDEVNDDDVVNDDDDDGRID